MSTYRRTLKVSKWDILTHNGSRAEFYFIKGKIQSAKALWRKHGKKLGYV